MWGYKAAIDWSSTTNSLHPIKEASITSYAMNTCSRFTQLGRNLRNLRKNNVHINFSMLLDISPYCTDKCKVILLHVEFDKTLEFCNPETSTINYDNIGPYNHSLRGISIGPYCIALFFFWWCFNLAIGDFRLESPK